MATLPAAASADAARIQSNLRWEPCAGEGKRSLCGAVLFEGGCSDGISKPTETLKGETGEKRPQNNMKLSVQR